jgi:hypothetical protein
MQDNDTLEIKYFSARLGGYHVQQFPATTSTQGAMNAIKAIALLHRLRTPRPTPALAGGDMESQ